jgi:hypothetical protein
MLLITRESESDGLSKTNACMPDGTDSRVAVMSALEFVQSITGNIFGIGPCKRAIAFVRISASRQVIQN